MLVKYLYRFFLYKKGRNSVQKNAKISTKKTALNNVIVPFEIVFDFILLYIYIQPCEQGCFFTCTVSKINKGVGNFPCSEFVYTNSYLAKLF